MTQTTIGGAPQPFTSPRPPAGPMLGAARGAGDDAALETARLLAARSGSEVDGVAVLAPLPMFLTGTEPVVLAADVEADREADLKERVSREIAAVAGADSGWPVEVFHGEPARVLAGHAHDRQASLVVMGIGRHRPIDRLISGETALRTIRLADCPVLAVAPGLAGLPRSVVVATDFSPSSANAARTALGLIGATGTMHLVHVWQPCEREDERLEARDADYRRVIPDEFRRFTAALSVPPGVTVKHEVREGAAAERVLDFARAHHVELIAAGRQGHGLIERLWIGSVASALVRGATCSVLVTPPPVGDRLTR